MTAITRAASTAPLSISSARPDASETCRMGTLRTSMGSGTGSPLCYDDGTGIVDDCFGARACRAPIRDGVGDAVQRCDDGALAAALDEPAGGLDLGPHRAFGEVAGGLVGPQLGHGHETDGALRWLSEVEGHVRHVGRDDQH